MSKGPKYGLERVSEFNSHQVKILEVNDTYLIQRLPIDLFLQSGMLAPLC